jgi:hypothetical protein
VTIDEHPMKNAVIGVAHDQVAGTPARSAQVGNSVGVLEGLARNQRALVGHRDLPGTEAGAIDRTVTGLIGARRRACTSA